MIPSEKILVFTDIHIDLDQRPDAPDAETRLRAGIKHALAHQGDADRVIITGDLTHKGDAASYRRLKELLAPLKMPVHLLLGNHDNRANFLSVFSETPIDEHGFVQEVIDLPDARLVMLDTLFGPPYDYPASHAGSLCEKRLAWFERALTESDKPSIVFMHHPPHDSGFAAMDAIKLRESDAFYDIAARSGTIRYLICGHIHRTISGIYRGVPYAMFKSFVGQMPMNFESTNTKIEVCEPPAYGILLLQSDGVVVHSEDFLIPR